MSSSIGSTMFRKAYDFETSLYAMTTFNGEKIFGGSFWDRKNIPYEEVDTGKIDGLLRIPSRDREIVVPHMVYGLETIDDTLYVGMKSGDVTHLLLDKDMNIIKQVSDDLSKGIYNVVKDEDHLVCTTRSGHLIKLDKNLNKVKTVKISEDSRLWSLDKARQGYICGTYQGKIAFVDKDFETQHTFDLETLYEEDERLQDGYGPSAWGVYADTFPIVVDRWGGITFFDNQGNVAKHEKVEDFSFCNVTKWKNELFLGDRYGRLVRYDDGNVEVVKEHKPKTQKENAAWLVTVEDDDLYTCFSDGQVVKSRI